MWKKDDNYSYRLHEKYENHAGVTGYVFQLTSQKWLDESIYVVESHGTAVWKHWVVMWVPNGRTVDERLLDTAILFIDGGSNNNNEPNEDDTFVTIGRVMTQLTGGIYVNIKQIPNQPLIFNNDWKEKR